MTDLEKWRTTMKFSDLENGDFFTSSYYNGEVLKKIPLVWDKYIGRGKKNVQQWFNAVGERGSVIVMSEHDEVVKQETPVFVPCLPTLNSLPYGTKFTCESHGIIYTKTDDTDGDTGIKCLYDNHKIETWNQDIRVTVVK